MNRRAFAGAAIGLAAIAIVLILDAALALYRDPAVPGPYETFELKTYDWRLTTTARPETARQDIALIEIDEYSLQNLEGAAGRWPWPRVVHASLIDFLARGPAKIVAYDVTFGAADTRTGFTMGEATLSGAESDAAFADAVKTSGNVLLLADATFNGEKLDAVALPPTGFTLTSAGLLERQTLLLPYPQLSAAAAGFGHNYFALDADGPLRHTVPFIRAPKGIALPSLGLSAALKASGVTGDQVAMRDGLLTIGGQRVPLAAVRTRTPDGLESFYWRPIVFRGPALLDDMKSRPYPSYAFYDLLYSEEQILAGEKPKVDPAIFKDKIVFVGATASGLFDVFETPFARGKMPGIQIHAAVADDLLSQRSIAQVSRTAGVFIVLALSFAVGLIAAYVPAWWAVAATLAVVGAYAWMSVVLFARGSWLPLTEPMLSSSIALFGGVAYQYFIEGREKRQVSRLFGRYVSKDVYSQLMADPARAQLGGQRREMTVLFSDMRGFTTLTEQGQPEVIVRTLNEYFTRMVDLVFLHKGTLDKFVGDMVMALFGAPLDDADHADHAVEAALDMVAELGRLNERWRAEGRAELDIGIGINSGSMIAGNIGSEAIMSYTVIGDAVNLGARLESLNKQYGTRIIISDATRQQLKRRYVLRPLGDVVVKGKSQAVSIFEVVGRDADASAKAQTVNEARV